MQYQIPKTQEERIKILEQKAAYLEERNNLLGRQIAEMKELYSTTLTEVKILKEGGNL